MMNLYGDDRKYLDGENKYAYKKGIVSDMVSRLFGILNPVNQASIASRNLKILKAESDIKSVNVKDTEKLKKILDNIFAGELERREYGKAISNKHIENFVAKCIQNNTGILTEKDIKYFTEELPKQNGKVIERIKENKISVRIKGAIKEKYESSTLYRHILAKRITKEINEVDFKNTKALKDIYQRIEKNEFTNSYYGKFLSNETLKTFISKIEKNNDTIVSESSMKSIKNELSKNKQNEIKM